MLYGSPMDVEGLKDWLLREAQALGFRRTGIANCEPFHAKAPHLSQWLAEGGERLFPYLSAEALVDPRQVMAEARSALVGFFPYARPDALPGAAPGSVKVSRYLWGKDYHMTLKGRLNRLLDSAREHFPGLEGRVCVDTAPLLERQLAVRAGLGWQGRHTLLIAGKDGSWGFLGVLLLNAELLVDAPFEGHRCGSCRACIEACPSQALSEFRLDPARCLTTYTIETEVEPPEDVAAALASTAWMAGCDVCQEVCPWNREPLWGDPGLWGGESPLHTLPAEALAVNGSQWRKFTRRTALRRVRHRHWLVNLGRVLGRELALPAGEDPAESSPGEEA